MTYTYIPGDVIFTITPDLPTKMIPTKICRTNNSGKRSKGLRIPPLNIKIMFESNPHISRAPGARIRRCAAAAAAPRGPPRARAPGPANNGLVFVAGFLFVIVMLVLCVYVFSSCVSCKQRALHVCIRACKCGYRGHTARPNPQ